MRKRTLYNTSDVYKRLQSLRQEVTAAIAIYHNLDDRTKCDSINIAVQLYYINRLLDDIIEES